MTALLVAKSRSGLTFMSAIREVTAHFYGILRSELAFLQLLWVACQACSWGHSSQGRQCLANDSWASSLLWTQSTVCKSMAFVCPSGLDSCSSCFSWMPSKRVLCCGSAQTSVFRKSSWQLADNQRRCSRSSLESRCTGCLFCLLGTSTAW